MQAGLVCQCPMVRTISNAAMANEDVVDPSSDSAQVDIVCKQVRFHLVHLVQYMLEVTSSIIQDNNV